MKPTLLVPLLRWSVVQKELHFSSLLSSFFRNSIAHFENNLARYSLVTIITLKGRHWNSKNCGCNSSC
jgi:hypothetical protein